jgi:hypothetical protein
MQPEVIDIKSPAGNGVYITYQTVKHMRPTCGHRLDLHRLPKHRNCNFCWVAFWQNNGEAVKTADEMFNSDHPEALEQIIGTKGVRKFLGFMSVIANAKTQGINNGD